MNFSKKDFNEIEEINQLLKKTDNTDLQYFDAITDEMYQYQPFLLSILLGYNYDLKANEVGEIIKLYCIIWEYFKDKKYIKTRKITEKQFEKLEKKNLHFFKYIEQSEAKDKYLAVLNDLENHQSNALLTAIFYRFNTRPILISMDEDIKGIITIGIKSIVECFEEISYKN